LLQFLSIQGQSILGAKTKILSIVGCNIELVPFLLQFVSEIFIKTAITIFDNNGCIAVLQIRTLPPGVIQCIDKIPIRIGSVLIEDLNIGGKGRARQTISSRVAPSERKHHTRNNQIYARLKIIVKNFVRELPCKTRVEKNAVFQLNFQQFGTSKYIPVRKCITNIEPTHPRAKCVLSFNLVGHQWTW